MASYNTASVIDSIITQSKDSEFSRDLVLEYVQRTQDLILGRHIFKFSEHTEEAIVSEDDTLYQYDCEHQQILSLVLVDDSSDTPVVHRPTYFTQSEFFDSYPYPEANKNASPSVYTDYNGEILFSSPLDKDYTFIMRDIISSKVLEDSTDSCPQIPREFSDVLIEGGLAGIEAFRENLDICSVLKRVGEDLADDLLGRYAPRKAGPGKSRTRGVAYGKIPRLLGRGLSNGSI